MDVSRALPGWDYVESSEPPRDGAVILLVRGHVMAAVHGVIYDTQDSRGRKVIGYWIRSPIA